SMLTFLLRKRLGAIHRRVVFALAFLGTNSRQIFLRGGDVVPGAIGEIDQRLAVAVDGDHTSYHPCEPLQLRTLGLNLHELVHPFLPQLLVEGITTIHRLHPIFRWARNPGGARTWRLPRRRARDERPRP